MFLQTELSVKVTRSKMMLKVVYTVSRALPVSFGGYGAL